MSGLAPFSVVEIETMGNSIMGKAIHADALVADVAEQHQHGGQHERQHVALDGKFGQGHFCAPLLAVSLLSR